MHSRCTPARKERWRASSRNLRDRTNQRCCLTDRRIPFGGYREGRKNECIRPVVSSRRSRSKQTLTEIELEVSLDSKQLITSRQILFMRSYGDHFTTAIVVGAQGDRKDLFTREEACSIKKHHDMTLWQNTTERLRLKFQELLTDSRAEMMNLNKRSPADGH